jgi:hypothetical protein
MTRRTGAVSGVAVVATVAVIEPLFPLAQGLATAAPLDLDTPVELGDVAEPAA